MTVGMGAHALHRLLRLACLAVGLASVACGSAGAQVVPANVAVPFYTPPAFMQGVYRYWYAPQSAAFATQADVLVQVVGQLCNAAADAPTTLQATQRARAQWQATAIVWDRLAAVAIGPLLQRRSVRQIDFAPTRPELITRAITSLGQAGEGDAKAMERIGTPAKGFPALEWLLWTRPVQPGTPACRYAHRVARDIGDEARTLEQAFAALAAHDTWADEEAHNEAAPPAMAELLNQWVGALERLRWAHMEKPLRSSAGHGARGAVISATAAASAFPRSASGSTAASWAAQWQAIAAMGVAGRAKLSEAVPAPGRGLVSLEIYLRGRGLNPLANKLAAGAGQVQQALPSATPANRAKLLAATGLLGQLKRLVEAEVAPVLEVNIGFSDADGD